MAARAKSCYKKCARHNHGAKAPSPAASATDCGFSVAGFLISALLATDQGISVAGSDGGNSKKVYLCPNLELYLFMRYRIDMCYDGRPFCGWQVQPSDPSVQGEMERALATLLKAPVGVVGAGRTDTGVSASAYVAHFDFDGEFDCKQLRYKLNAILPAAIAVQDIRPVPDGFHARFSAVSRQYQYFLHRVKDPFLEQRSYYFGYPEVDFYAMNRAAQLLLGPHDFSCFEKTGGDNKTSVCSVTRAIWEPYCPDLPLAPVPLDPSLASVSAETESVTVSGSSSVNTVNDASGHPFWRFTIEADRFLRNMVRAIVGTLLEVGRGRRSVDDFAALALPPDRSIGSADATDPAFLKPAPKSTVSLRSAAGESVPGHALFLTAVRY